MSVEEIVRETGCSVDDARKVIRKSFEIAVEARQQANAGIYILHYVGSVHYNIFFK
jgi:hypothetical protein